jgi:hypothetical protein
LTVEKLGIPTAPVITSVFEDLVKTNAYKKGMPLQRFTFVAHPVAGKPASECREYLKGNDPITGKPVMQEIIEALTKPLTEEEKKTGFIERPAPLRLVGPDTPENLQQLFLKNGWTDGLPIVLPTEEKVAEMLKGTSHKPDKVVATMRPSPPHEAWEYTVEKVAVNAVMAGAKPEYFPVILAIASTGITSLFTSTTSFARMVVINGPIRNEINMNSGIGALGPFNHANATIGRAWTLISRNLGGGGTPGSTYLGSQGNNFNYNNLCFAEKEENLPKGWNPLHVQKGFKPKESVVSMFSGWSIIDNGGFKPYPYHEVMKHQSLAFFTSGTGNCFKSGVPDSAALTLLLDPLVAKDLKEARGFNTKEELSQWLMKNTFKTAWAYWACRPDDLQKAKEGVEPYASWLKLPEGALVPEPVFFDPKKPIEIMVLGGQTNPFWQAGDFNYIGSASVDKWK